MTATSWRQHPAWRISRWFLLGLLVVLGTLATVIAVRTARFGSKQPQVSAAAPLALDDRAVLGRLSGALRYRSVSRDDPARFERAAFEGLLAYLGRSFPNLTPVLKRERVGAYSLLYTWPGSDPSLAPVLWLAHLDVVPAVEKSDGDGPRWTHPPFSGQLADGYIWGRGAMDDKGQVMAMLEAIAHLVSQNYRPRRGLILALGHDEEVGGTGGAVKIAALLERRQVRARFILDEGLVITKGIAPGLGAPAALIGVAEKGYLTVELIARSGGGHSSMPPRATAVGRLAVALQQVGSNPMPARLDGTTLKMFEYLGPELDSVWNRMVMANLWLFKAVVTKKLAAKPTTNAMIRTTFAPTMLEGSSRENVLPRQALARINVRIHPRDSVAGVLAHLRSVIRDPAVTLRARPGSASPPPPPSSVDGAGYRILARTIRQLYPKAVVAPGLMVATSDSRHYQRISSQIYRFCPLVITSADRLRFHGVDERIATTDYLQMVRFYVQLAKNALGGGATGR